MGNSDKKNLLDWIRLVIDSKYYDSSIIQWKDKKEKIFKYTKKRTKKEDKLSLSLFLDWAKYSNRSKNVERSAVKHGFRSALQRKQENGLVKELKNDEDGWYTWQILDPENTAMKPKANKNIEKEQNVGAQTVDKQTQTNNSETRKKRRGATDKLQPKAKESIKEKMPSILSNYSIQNGEISSTSAPLPSCSSLQKNLHFSSNLPPEQVEFFMNLDQELGISSQQMLNQNSNEVHTEHFHDIDTGCLCEVPSVSNEYFTNARFDLVSPNLIQQNDLIDDPKLSRDFMNSVQNHLAGQDQAPSLYETLTELEWSHLLF